jgi:hypothetical protein
VSTAQHTPKQCVWWHPEYPTPDGRRYCEASRTDAARLIREAKAARRLEVTADIHGRKHYSLLTFDRRNYTGRFCIAKAAGSTA